ncbi:hypothetical protein L6452_43187 [Arctium lappa]|uniref:Uncharacterized protein n=1 Tax=Arctium lappa TaxID=4217 RepID=A0ACB8XKK6_ARCLA|nr:hypothetical protein L6452_43187 [Arctium lappa]
MDKGVSVKSVKLKKKKTNKEDTWESKYNRQKRTTLDYIYIQQYTAYVTYLHSDAVAAAAAFHSSFTVEHLLIRIRQDCID